MYAPRKKFDTNSKKSAENYKLERIKRQAEKYKGLFTLHSN